MRILFSRCKVIKQYSQLTNVWLNKRMARLKFAARMRQFLLFIVAITRVFTGEFGLGWGISAPKDQRSFYSRHIECCWKQSTYGLNYCFNNKAEPTGFGEKKKNLWKVYKFFIVDHHYFWAGILNARTRLQR